jgi:hypothetical protein
MKNYNLHYKSTQIFKLDEKIKLLSYIISETQIKDK